jgi:hypothetical protein
MYWHRNACPHILVNPQFMGMHSQLLGHPPICRNAFPQILGYPTILECIPICWGTPANGNAHSHRLGYPQNHWHAFSHTGALLQYVGIPKKTGTPQYTGMYRHILGTPAYGGMAHSHILGWPLPLDLRRAISMGTRDYWGNKPRQKNLSLFFCCCSLFDMFVNITNSHNKEATSAPRMQRFQCRTVLFWICDFAWKSKNPQQLQNRGLFPQWAPSPWRPPKAVSMGTRVGGILENNLGQLLYGGAVSTQHGI